MITFTILLTYFSFPNFNIIGGWTVLGDYYYIQLTQSSTKKKATILLKKQNDLYKGIALIDDSLNSKIESKDLSDFDNIINSNIETNCAYFSINGDEYEGNYQYGNKGYYLTKKDSLKNIITEIEAHSHCSFKPKRPKSNKLVKNITINIVLDKIYSDKIIGSKEDNLTSLINKVNEPYKELNIQFKLGKIQELPTKKVQGFSNNLFENFKTHVLTQDPQIQIGMWHLILDCTKRNDNELGLALRPSFCSKQASFGPYYIGDNPGLSYSCGNEMLEITMAHELMHTLGIDHDKMPEKVPIRNCNSEGCDTGFCQKKIQGKIKCVSLNQFEECYLMYAGGEHCLNYIFGFSKFTIDTITPKIEEFNDFGCFDSDDNTDFEPTINNQPNSNRFLEFINSNLWYLLALALVVILLCVLACIFKKKGKEFCKLFRCNRKRF